MKNAAMRPMPLVNPAEQWWSGMPLESERAAAALLQTESAGGRHQRSVYELFAEMEEKDGHLHAVLQTRRNAVLGAERAVTAGGSQPYDGTMRDFVAGALEAIPDFDGLLRALLDAMAKGFAAVELIWGYDSLGRIVVVDWRAHRQEHFTFTADGELRLLSPPFEDGAQTVETSDLPMPFAARGAPALARALVPPEQKFVVLRFDADARNPFGRGLCQRAYWAFHFKKHSLRFWAIFNEKYGAPTPVATFPSGTSRDERERLAEVVRSLQTDGGAVLPETVTLKLLEAGRSSDGSAFREFADWCNDEMSKLVLGGTLTSGEGRRSGSLALGSVHDNVRHDYFVSDARLLESAINDTLVRWLVERNNKAAAAPRWRLNTVSQQELQARVETDKALIALGVPLPMRYFHERYGRPQPQPAEPMLRYDDANLFGYHLRYGILTVNEARERMGLARVPWGDRPANVFPAAGASAPEVKGATRGPGPVAADPAASRAEVEAAHEPDPAEP